MSEQWFTKEASLFLRELKEKNSKKWYLDHKDVYQEVILDPFIDFVDRLSKTMLKIDDKLEVRPQIDKTISRIYRDTRFSRDKSLYKDRVWVTFKRHGASNSDYPAFFFELTPYDYRYGMGFFAASPKSMSALRDTIDKREQSFIQIIKQINEDNIFTLEGDMYKKTYYQGTNKEVASWYNRKNVYLVYKSNDLSELFVQDRIDKIKDEFVTLADTYNFMTSAISGSVNAK